MKRRLFYILWVAILLALPFFSTPPQPVTATVITDIDPIVMVEEGANDHTLGGNKLYWRTLSDCSEPPGRTPQDPEIIQRIFTSGSMKRTLLYENDSRPTHECNPYHIYSNIVADSNYVYFADDSGLVRLSASANIGDAPTLMSATIQSTGNSRKVLLSQNNTHVFAMIYMAHNTTTQVWAIRKSDSTQEIVANFSGFARDLSSDETYIFWIVPSSNTLIMAYRFVAGYTTETITTGVASFATEGEKTYCLMGCTTTHYVFIAKNNQIFRYDVLTQAMSAALYTSSSPDAPYIYNITTDGLFVFFYERRENLPCPECLLIYTQVLFRMNRMGIFPSPLYTHTSPYAGYTNIQDLDTDGAYLYWQQDDQILKFPNNAAELSQTNITIDRWEINQAIQNTSNSVALIGGRRTMVRVFAKGDGDDVENVTAFLYRVNPTTGAEISGPLAPVNRAGTHLTIFDNPQPANIDSSFNFELPLAWVQSGTPLRLKIVVNPYNTPLESNPNDNTSLSATFTPIASPTLEVEFYSLGFTDSNNISHYLRITKDIEQTFSWIRRTYPLASDPAQYNSPGFHPNLHSVHMSELDSLVDGTHKFCKDFAEKGLCATAYVNNKLRAWQEADEEADGTAYIYYGWIPDTAGFPRGQGGGGIASGPAGCCLKAWDKDGAYTDWYTAHELAHAIGRLHPVPGSGEDACDHSGDDADYPYPGSDIGLMGVHWGFDMGDKAFGLKPLVADSSVWHDFMGYCDYQWISDYTYMGLYNQIPDWDGSLRQHRAPAGDYLAIYGTIFPENNSAYLTHVNKQTANTIPPLVAGPYAIRLLDDQNQQLAEYAFTPDEPEEGANFFSFGQMVTFVAGTRHVQIVKLEGNVVLVDHVVSANAPTVSNVQATAGSNPIAGEMTISWTGADADNDTLAYDVFYSQDGGTTFLPYLTGLTASSTTADSEVLGGGSTIFRVVATDGSLTGSGDSPAVTLVNKPPQPTIYNPGDGDVVQWGQLISFIGQGFDLQDGSVVGTNMVWSNQNGVLGTGGFVDVADLPVGENIITLTVTNSLGLSSGISITVFVEDDATPAEATLEVAPNIFGWHIGANVTEVQEYTFLVANAGSGDLEWSVSSDAEWLTLDVITGTNSSSVTAYADPAGLTDGETWSANLTVTGQAEGGPVQTQIIPVTLSMGDVWTTLPLLPRRTFLPLIIRD